MATHASTLPWRIPWTEEPGKLQYSPWSLIESDTTKELSLFAEEEKGENIFNRSNVNQ